MDCVRPPLLKKPARGFGWSCGPCSRRQEKKLEARNTPTVGEKAIEGEEEEFVDEEEDEHAAASGNGSGSVDGDVLASGARPPTAEQIAQAKLWPFRYLGLHCRVEDALDYDDRIYPRASSRLGPKHQATVQVWPGKPVEFVKSAEVKRKYYKGNSHKKDAKLTRDTIAALDATKIARGKRPKHVMDEPPGYIARGDDYSSGDVRSTAHLSFRLPEVGETSSRGGSPNTSDPDRRERLIDDYMSRAKALAPQLDLKDHSTNFLDKALQLFTANNYQSDKALQQLRNLNKRKDLKEPELTKEELRRFEDGVRRYGSELRLVSKHVGKTQKHGEIVRFYYMWKKTPEGRKIWGNYEGRKGKKQQKQTDSKLVDDVADDIDDSAFDIGKATARRRGFECKFCAMRHSPQWRRAPATAPGTTVPIDPSLKNSKDKNSHLMLALCQRCAYLWRCYAITWENPDEVAKKVASGGGRAWKRRIDEELLSELTTANVASSVRVSTSAAAAAASIGVDIPPILTAQSGQDVPKKKQRLGAVGADTSLVLAQQNVTPIEPPKKKLPEKPPEPPLIPEEPRYRILPCAICCEFVPGEETTDEYLFCVRCRLTVHRSCYGVVEGRAKDKWTCDMCANDTSHHYSTNYDCVLCSVREYTDKEIFEAPKSHHKKKNDREKEKERLERELVVTNTETHYRTQRERGRPEHPRQPLKRTTNKNWVHVVCAIFHYEIKFADPKALEPAEGFGAVPVAKFRLKCKLCRKAEGACINCSHCLASVHVTCAQQHGYQLGFDISPVKGSRASAVNIVDMNGDKGSAAAVLYCKEHAKAPYHRDEKKGIHTMAEILADAENPESNINALQAYARSHKQADTSLTGTLRKALMLDSATSTATQLATAGAIHRGSVSSVASGAIGNSIPTPTTRGSRMSPGALTFRSDEVDQDGDRVVYPEHVTQVEPLKICLKCHSTQSPKWYPSGSNCRSESDSASRVERSTAEENVSSQPAQALVNGHINGHNLNEHGNSAAPVAATHLERSIGLNGDFDGDGMADKESPSDPTALNSHPSIEGDHSMQESVTFNTVKECPNRMCHRCYQRQRKQPTPPRMPTPPPEPVVSANAEDPVDDIQPEAPVSDEPEPSSPPVPLVWPSQVARASSRDSYQGWPAQTVPPAPPTPLPPSVPSAASAPSALSAASTPAPPSVPPAPPVAPPAAPYHGPDRLPNGVPPSPPVVAPPPPQHYPPPPQSHHSVNYAPPPQNYRDSRGVLHRGMPPQYHVPHLANGVPSEPPSFQYRRDQAGHLYQVPYVPQAMRPQQASALRSPPPPPPMHDRSSQGPHGPPEAAENPFAVPTAAHSPPRQAFGSIYGSPSGGHERPETPPGGYAREGRWSSEGVMVNGASASPSLRNLLQ